MATKPDSLDRILLPLVPIPHLSSAVMQRELERVSREFNQQMEIERRAQRADSHRCHCPHCTVIG